MVFLPAELQVHVAQELDRDDFKSLRLVCKFANAAAAAARRTLQRVSALSSFWTCIPHTHQALLDSPDTLSRVKDLRLASENIDYLILESTEREEGIASLNCLLSASLNVESLQLNFGGVPWEQVHRRLFPIARCLFGNTWQSLLKLDLTGLVTTEDDFIDFLRKQNASLRYLHLTDIQIIADEVVDHEDDTQPLPGSVLSLFVRMNEGLILESVRLLGNFSNGYDEAWCAEEGEGPHSLVTRIEKWLARKRLCPLPPGILDHRRRYQAREDEDSNIDDEDSEDDRGLDPEEWGDYTWMWTPDLLLG